MPHNDTYGEISELELADLRTFAVTCRRCGMVATIDPVFHENRYGHAPAYYDVQTGSVYVWDGAAARWEVQDMDDEPHAVAGPDQAEDNYVNPLACGHELDDVEQLPAGHIVNCSQHGLTKVVAS